MLAHCKQMLTIEQSRYIQASRKFCTHELYYISFHMLGLVPISFILAAMVSVSAHAAFASDHLRTAWNKQGYLTLVSNIMSNDSSSLNGENARII
jgi:hypothetical protein